MRKDERQLVVPGAVLDASYLGRQYTCHVEDRNGRKQYRVEGLEVYPSLSRAAMEVVRRANPGRLRSETNGWTFWELRKGSSSAVTATPRETWLFQFNPTRYDLSTDLDAGNSIIRWAMNQSYRRVGEGDPVYLFESGPQGGVVAIGTVVSPGAVKLETPDEFGAWKVDLAVDFLVDPPLTRTELLADSVLRNLEVFRFANASNYAMAPAEAERLDVLIQSRRREYRAPTIVRLIDDATELEEAEAHLRERFAAGATFSGGRSVGYQGGQSEEAQLYWHDEHQVWGCIDELPDPPLDRFWNGFGSRDPRLPGGLSISCEVNPAREGINARTAGVFAIDPALGHRLLLHRGRIGGGRAGVGSEAFWSNTKLPAVTAEGDLDRRFVVVADLDGPDVPGQIARFVREVDRIKTIATQPPQEVSSSGSLTTTGRYAALADWLRDQTASEVTTSFAHIESLVGPLPAYAREHAAFWYGSAAGSPTHVQKRVWESAGFTVKTVSLPNETVTFNQLADKEDLTATLPRYWWVNQGQPYDREMAGGYVWAPVRAKNGQELAHHKAVTEMRVGDFVLHYQRGIRSVGRVAAPPAFAAKPDEITEDAWEDDGRLARIDYTVLDESIPLDRIPITWRIEEGGPFNSSGAVNQAYMFPLSVDFVRRLAGRFPEIEAALGIEPADDITVGEPVTDLSEIGRSVRAESLRIDDRTLRRFHLAMQTRGFVILSGISGTGKTWLAEAYARAVQGGLLLVPVAPNWNTNEDLLGYLNPIDGKYHDTTFSRFVRAAGAEWLEAQAEQRPARPFFLVLDEMNLARVEYYFAQFLSALEVRARAGTGMLHLGHDEVPLGGNLKFVGTVNIDETTHGFADKVYDRAQLIELAAPRDALEAHIGDVAHADALLEVWDAIHGVAPFAFRVVDEIDVYVREAGDLGVPWADALDEQLLQKVLPKVRGLDPAAGEALEAFVALSDGRFPLSHTKATEMLARFNQHGSVSFFG